MSDNTQTHRESRRFWRRKSAVSELFLFDDDERLDTQVGGKSEVCGWGRVH